MIWISNLGFEKKKTLQNMGSQTLLGKDSLLFLNKKDSLLLHENKSYLSTNTNKKCLDT